MSSHVLPEPWPLEDLVKGLDSPQFTSLPVPEGSSGFVIRRYCKANWATAQMSESEVSKPNQGTRESFFKLLGYISGQNSKEEKISMTAPVLTVWEQNPSADTMKSGQLQFYIANNVQSSPPTPTGAVSLEAKEELTVFVRAFGGDPTPAQYQAEYHALFSSITSAGLCADLSTPIRAGYTKPGDSRRRNEIMYPQIPCPTHTAD